MSEALDCAICTAEQCLPRKRTRSRLSPCANPIPSIKTMTIDLKIAYEKFHQLQLEDGDLGAEYWLAVAAYLREAELTCFENL